jgi:hypothetical protein
MQEIWIKYNEPRIKISNYGNVNIINELNYKLSTKDNYQIIRNVKNDKYYYVHQIIADEFLKNDDPNHKTTLYHRDGDTMCNHIANLKWCYPINNVNDYNDDNFDNFDDVNDEIRALFD